MDARLIELGVDRSTLNQFRGAYITRGYIHCPFQDEDEGYFPINIDEAAISSEAAILLLSMDYSSLEETVSITNSYGQQQEISLREITSAINLIEHAKIITENDKESSTLKILMYIQK